MADVDLLSLPTAATPSTLAPGTVTVTGTTGATSDQNKVHTYLRNIGWTDARVYRAQGMTDVASVQAAVNAVGGAGGGRVFIPGPWNFGTTSMTIAYSNVELRGTPETVITSAITSATGAIEVNGSALLTGVTISTVRLVGAYDVGGLAKGILFRGAFGATRSLVENVTLQDFGDSAIMVADGTPLTRSAITGFDITHCGNFGVVLNSDTTPGTITDIDVDGGRVSGLASVLYPSHGVYFKGVWRASCRGVNVRASTGSNADGITAAHQTLHLDIVACNVEGSTGGMSFNDTHHLAVIGTSASNCTGNHAYTITGLNSYQTFTANTVKDTVSPGKGFFVSAITTAVPTNISIVANVITGSGSTGGIGFTETTAYLCALNQIDLTGDTTHHAIDSNGSTNGDITGNSTAGGDVGIQVRTSPNASTGNRVTSNRISAVATYGIRVDTGVGDVWIAFNDARNSGVSSANTISVAGGVTAWLIFNLGPSGALSIGSTTGLTLGFSGQNVGVYGQSTARAAAISSPTADVTALKTAVDAIRVALTNFGITS